MNFVHRIISAGFATAALASAAVPALGGSGWSEADAEGSAHAASATQATAQRPALAAGHSAGAAVPATPDSERR